MTAMILCFDVFLNVVAHGSVKIMLLSSMHILKYDGLTVWQCCSSLFVSPFPSFFNLKKSLFIFLQSSIMRAILRRHCYLIFNLFNKKFLCSVAWLMLSFSLPLQTVYIGLECSQLACVAAEDNSHILHCYCFV